MKYYETQNKFIKIINESEANPFGLIPHFYNPLAATELY